MRYLFFILILFLCVSSLAQSDIFPFRSGKEWYYTDKNFNKISDKVYEETFPFYNEYAVVKIQGKYGFIDKNEKLIIPAMYEYARINYFNHFEVLLNGERFLIDLNNNRLILQSVCYSPGLIGGPYNLIICEENGLLGVDNFSGKSLPPIYDSISIVSVSHFMVVVDTLDKFGIYGTRSLELKKTYPTKLDSISIYRGLGGHAVDYALIYENGKVGAIDLLGDVIAFPKYENLCFEYFFAPYTILDDGQKGYILGGVEYWRE